MFSIDVIQSSFSLRGVRFQELPRKLKIRKQKRVLVPTQVFQCLTSLRRNITKQSRFLASFNSLNNKRDNSTTCSSCRTILTLLSTERSEWYIFILTAALHEFAKSQSKIITATKARDDRTRQRAKFSTVMFQQEGPPLKHTEHTHIA